MTRGIDSVFPAALHRTRLDRTRATLADHGRDAALFTGPENIFWLTGQQTPGTYTFQALLLPVAAPPLFFIRSLETPNFLRNTHDLPLPHHPYGDGDDPIALVLDALQHRGLHQIAVEKQGGTLPIRLYDALLAQHPAIADASGLVEAMRRVKTPDEIARIRAAAAQAEQGMIAGLAAIRPGATENDIVAAMMHATIATGAEYVGMQPLVASGPRSGIPHATWRRRTLQPNDPVFLELSGCHDRYHAGLMRTAWLGQPPPLARQLEATALHALDAAITAATPGASCAAPALAALAVIDAAGMTDRFRKRAGYSLGIAFAPDWGEWQVASLHPSAASIPLEPGMCFHIPITLREWGAFTIGISETILIGPAGPETLGALPRGIQVLP